LFYAIDTALEVELTIFAAASITSEVGKKLVAGAIVAYGCTSREEAPSV